MKKERRKIKIEVVDSVNQFGDMTDEELLNDSEQYDRDNYDPLKDLNEYTED